MAITDGSAQRWFASHELRTPLQAIKGGVELLLEARGSGLSALQVEALGLIAGATAELERCVEMLAELAGLEEESDPPITPCELGAWLADPAVARHLQPTRRLTAAAGFRVLIVPSHFGRALQHLTAATPGDRTAPLACDLVAIEAATCVLGLAVGPAASGDGAVAHRLASALFAHGGAALRKTGSREAHLTLRRAA